MIKNIKISRRNFIKNSAVGLGTAGIGISKSNELFGNEKSLSNQIIQREKISPREVWVLSVSKERIEGNNSEKITKDMIERMNIMASYKPDIICLPEVFATSVKTAETIPGPIIETFISYAKEHNCYIICPIHTKKSNKVYNSAVLIDRKGNIVGQYDKIHPTENECDNKVTPGNSPPPVFKTDFGTIGILICFDINWIEEWKSLKEQGAEIVFWTAAFPGGRMLSSYAWFFQYYVVGCSLRDPILIYDVTGDLIFESGIYEHWAFCPLNLEKIFCEIDYHTGKVRDIRKKYGRKVGIRYLHNEDWVILESCSPDLPIKQIVDEYGLVSHWDYIKRAEKYQKKFR